MKNKQQKSGGGFSSLIAALCIVIYLFALVQAAVRLYLSMEQYRVIAGNEFIKIRDLAVSTGSQGFMDDRFIQTMNNTLLSSKALEALIISGPNEEYAFEKQKGRAILWVNNSPRFINRLSFSNVTYYDPLPINNLRNANIKAVANAFNYDDISRILRETLLLILIGFAVSFFTMLFQILLGGKTQEKNFKHAQMPAQTYPPPPPPMQNYAPQQTQDYVPIQQSRAPADSGPKGLYSSRSNIGWEEYTKDRLDAEIHRCASTEKDLTFITIEFATAISDKTFKAIAEDAAILSSKDMLFEYGSQGICAILPGTDLDSGIAKSEKFYQRVMQNNPEYDPGIGLTSRSGRLINAERLMMESKEALHRAKSDQTTSIIAFKSDPDKYRAFISQQN
ncbi:MAG: hypothetical protein LBU88_03645 [Treponema sp.]|jgi:hypothetical protein|nr:hypothetical protein [Treponema sp.]